VSATFFHAADWQLGNPLAGIEGPRKRVPLRNQRLAAIKRLGGVARERGAEFVVVAGDLLDSPTATKAPAAACGAIGSLAMPVYVILDVHDALAEFPRAGTTYQTRLNPPAGALHCSRASVLSSTHA
jgi:hypothetical protein